MFLIWVILLILGTVLVLISSEFVNIDYISMLTDVQRICKRNRSSFTLNFLLEQVSEERNELHARMHHFPSGKGHRINLYVLVI